MNATLLNFLLWTLLLRSIRHKSYKTSRFRTICLLFHDYFKLSWALAVKSCLTCSLSPDEFLCVGLVSQPDLEAAFTGKRHNTHGCKLASDQPRSLPTSRVCPGRCWVCSAGYHEVHPVPLPLTAMSWLFFNATIKLQSLILKLLLEDLLESGCHPL